ncbi:NAD(P)/FAD-dependent oxidoreductase [Jatrophihabitans telluris]|uniref:NAD(P)/FAD-dependent oxidoreductase n=1 Tax=Jatrophihabitans telluris TaxID=2038343 RepID=UPI0024C0D48B|nr:NAD(P)/FAD-dependent oxidoreductase [Jatrophihabitans telluris]
MNEVDVVVVGGGAAGLSAALVLARARRNILVIDAGSPRNAPAAHMHGFLSRDGFPPAELLTVARAEITGYGGKFVTGTVTDVAPTGTSGFSLSVSDGQPITARRLLVATGLRDELPTIPGLADRWARDVLHCPYCHGYEVRDQRLAVLGSTLEAVKFTQIVRQWSYDVVLFAAPGTLSTSARHQLRARSIGIVEDEVTRIVVENDQLRGVEVGGGRVFARDAVFVPPRFVPNNHLLTTLNCPVDDAGWVVADSTGRTSVAGVWVAGNVVNPRAQVITAAGEGSAAAIAINADLVEEDIRDAVRNLDLKHLV